MKKITAALVATALLSATASFADTPAEREMTSFKNVLSVAAKKTSIGKDLTINQEARPCVNAPQHKAPAKKAEKHVKKAEKHAKKEHAAPAKKAEKHAKKAKKAHAAPAATPAAAESK